METVEQIKSLIEKMPLTSPQRIAKAREIKYIPETLLNGEVMELVIQAWLKDANTNGVLICTNKRLVFLDKGMISGLKTKSYQLNQIGSLELNTSFFSTKFKIHSSGTAPAEVQCFDKNDAKVFINHVNEKITNKETPAHHHVSGQISVTDELKKLGELKASGVLSDDEFNKLKMDLIK